jgi:NTE family protein
MTQAPSLTGVLGKTVGVVVASSEFKNIQAADVLVSADLKGYTAMDYDRWETLIPKGYEGAQKKASMLSAFALNDQDWQQYLAEREARKRKAPTMVASVQVTGVSPTQSRGIEDRLASDAGKPLDEALLSRQLTELRGTGRYQTLGYSLTDNGVLQVRAQQREGGQSFFIPGIMIDGSQRNNFQFAFGGRLTLMDIGGYPSEWRTDFLLGQQTHITTEYWRPFNAKTHWFIAPRGLVGSDWVNYYVNGKPVATYQIGAGGGGVDLGYSITASASSAPAMRLARSMAVRLSAILSCLR